MIRGRTFALPLACAGLLIGGLLLALIGDGWADATGCAAIVLAFIFALSQGARSSPVALWAFRLAAGGLLLTFLAALVQRQVQLGDWAAITWIIGHLAVYAIRILYVQRNGSDAVRESRADMWERLILACMTLTMMVLPPLCLITDAADFAVYTLPLGAQITGAAMLVAGLWLFWRSHADLGRNWSVTLEVREAHSLVTRGVYSRIRHPMYTAIALISFAQPLLLKNWIAGPPVLIALITLLAIRTPREEAMMHDRFGEEWLEYLRRSHRFLPRF